MVLRVLTLTGYQEIDISLVHYLRYAKNIITIQGDNLKFLSRGTLLSWKKELPQQFVSIDRSTIINVLYIKSYNPNSAEVEMLDGEIFKVSRRKQQALRDVVSSLYNDVIPVNRINLIS